MNKNNYLYQHACMLVRDSFSRQYVTTLDRSANRVEKVNVSRHILKACRALRHFSTTCRKNKVFSTSSAWFCNNLLILLLFVNLKRQLRPQMPPLAHPAREWDLSAYDAAYLQFAPTRRAPLITLDARLARAYDLATR
jgi:hypothetical protein